MAWSHGVFYWNELMTWDVEQAKSFYADTLGWTYEATPMEEGTYWIIKSGETTAGGMFQLTMPLFEGVPEGWMAYIAVDDIDARVAKATAAGAALMRPPFDVPGVGRIAIMREPGGAGIGWMTPASS
jgi:predicted enzyme related to lactoylglutathione lyase